jgi:hypothetical protein
MSDPSDAEWAPSDVDGDYIVSDDLQPSEEADFHSVTRESSVAVVETKQLHQSVKKQSLSDLTGEAEDVINAIEVEYFNNLSLHLYSSHLLRRRERTGKQDFPRARWYEWPQHPFSANYVKPGMMRSYDHNIPKPVTNTRYISEEDPTGLPLKDQVTNAILGQFVYNVRLPVLRPAVAPSFSPAETSRDPRIPGSVSISSIDRKVPLKQDEILDVDEGMKKAIALMLYELNAQYQRTVHARINEGTDGKLVPRVDEPIKMPPQVAAYLMDFLNTILDGLIQDQKTAVSNVLFGRINWTDLIHDNVLTGDALSRCKSLFIDGNQSQMLNHDEDILQHSSSSIHGPGKRARTLYEELSLKPIGVSRDELIDNCIIKGVEYPVEFNHIKKEVRKVSKRVKKASKRSGTEAI